MTQDWVLLGLDKKNDPERQAGTANQDERPGGQQLRRGQRHEVEEVWVSIGSQDSSQIGSSEKIIIIPWDPNRLYSAPYRSVHVQGGNGLEPWVPPPRGADLHGGARRAPIDRWAHPGRCLAVKGRGLLPNVLFCFVMVGQPPPKKFIPPTVG